MSKKSPRPTPSLLERFAYDAADDDEAIRLKKAIAVVAGGCSAAGAVWSAMYWMIFGWGLTAALPLSFTVIVGSALAISHVSKKHVYAVYAQILCIMYVTAFIQWSIGGVFASGFVFVWAFVGPVTALAFFPFRKSLFFFGLYLTNLAITLAFDDVFERHGLIVDERTRTFFFAMNVGVSATVVFFFVRYFAQSAETQRVRAEFLEESLEKAVQLGPYTLESKLGAGGMGVVYRARHALLRRPTAIKMLPIELVGEESLWRFEQEVQLTATLTHPNTVAIHDYGRSTDGVFYYAMEYLEGIDLETLIRQTGAIPPARVVHILTQVCGALSEAHYRGLVHRDIKPANIMLCRLGQRSDVAKVLDFGLVKELSTADLITNANVITGTPSYISPEAISTPDSVGPAADLYALGAVAYWLLTGRTVFRGGTSAEVLAHHLHTVPEPPSLFVPGIPPELESIVLRCLSKKASDRPASAKELQTLLEQVPLVKWSEEAMDACWSAFDEQAKRFRNVEEPVGLENTLVIDRRHHGDEVTMVMRATASASEAPNAAA